MATEAITVQSEGIISQQDKIDLIKRTVAKGTTNDELALFLYTAQRTGLDPLAKQIYAIKRWDKKQRREVMTIQTGIDGYRLVADRTKRYAPGRKCDFSYKDEGKNLMSATAYVMKLVEGTWHEVSAEAFWDEYVQTWDDGKPMNLWAKMPHTMLAKCAEALALRKAFPADLSGLYTFEEMQQADNAPKVESHDIQRVEGTIAEKKGTDACTVYAIGKTKCAIPADGRLDLDKLLAGADGKDVAVGVIEKRGPKGKYLEIIEVYRIGQYDYEHAQEQGKTPLQVAAEQSVEHVKQLQAPEDADQYINGSDESWLENLGQGGK